MMSCPYSERELERWDSVCNPIGEACYSCDECECEHWAGECPVDCSGRNDCCFGIFADDEP